jgi:hypothetical protein
MVLPKPKNAATPLKQINHFNKSVVMSGCFSLFISYASQFTVPPT